PSPSAPPIFPFAPSPFFSFTRPAPPAIYTLSLHDALPISPRIGVAVIQGDDFAILIHQDELVEGVGHIAIGYIHHVIVSVRDGQDRKSTRLNSSHVSISYAVFCLKKKTD